ncbi:MAG: polyprenyl synthetase family protein [Nitrospiraceae bacterium]|nr:polyprenyl synthetase family protein [Nitrospiraceae bacterium]
MDINRYLADRKNAVEAFFEQYFRKVGRPVVLREAMLYSLNAGGKRIRPVLCLASYEACGGNSDEIVPYAAALEFIHTYSLIHDDLPAMDDDDLRRGKPTSHKVYGEAMAILAGDALLTEAFVMLTDPLLGPAVRPDNLLRAAGEIARASGCRGMVAGQAQDMLSENSEPDEETLRFIHRHKTAALLRASVTAGALLYGGAPGVIDAMDRYGQNLGLAFQVVDDILDVEGDTEVIGKPAGSDEKKKKMTYPRMYGLDRSRDMARAFVADAVAALDAVPLAVDPLRELAFHLLGRRH